MTSIVHLSSAHPRDDVRIFHKQCRSLAAHGHTVSLVVADGLGDDRRDGIAIHDVGRAPNRLRRMLGTPRRVLARALALDAAIYQLHDPELMPIGLQLKRRGKTVIFDAHEDLPLQLLGKPYLGRYSAPLLARACARFERQACRRYDGVIAATPAIRDKFLRVQAHTVDINNFPLPQEFGAGLPWPQRPLQVCYVGGLSAIRGIRQLAQACALLASPVRLQLAGRFDDSALAAQMAALPGWTRVDALGQLDRAGVALVLGSARAGLVTLQPQPNHLAALPVKLFEYMAAGIPVIASDFPGWRRIVDGHGCGLCVDPLDPAAIAAAIDRLAGDPGLAERMGDNGRRAVAAHYNWPSEARKLVDFYERLTPR